MTRSRTAELSLTRLLDRSRRPVYAIDAERRIVYCNDAVAIWVGLESRDIVGQYVEYHSQPIIDEESSQSSARSLTGLCPPPAALAGEQAVGIVSNVARDGRLFHRHAEFVPLETRKVGSTKLQSTSMIVLLADRDLSPQELESELDGERPSDELHRTIRRFRRNQSAQYAIESILGNSAAIRKVRAQVKAAAASGANVVIIGRRGTGRSHIARAIHYRASIDVTVPLVPIECELVTEEGWRRAIDAMRRPSIQVKSPPTLLLDNCEMLAPEYQSQLYDAIRQNRLATRIIATLSEGSRHTPCAAPEPAVEFQSPNKAGGPQNLPTALVTPRLFSEVSTLTIHVPRLVERLEDLPILAQCLLESSNRHRDKQVGSIRPEALDLLALHDWPRELDELREVIESAHRAASSHQIMPADLPSTIHHAAKAAAFPARQPPEPIVLDELLGAIEKEVISRALAQARGNKTEAAALLGMTRPRLYRRLVQLAMISEATSEPASEEIIFEPESPGLEP